MITTIVGRGGGHRPRRPVGVPGSTARGCPELMGWAVQPLGSATRGSGTADRPPPDRPDTWPRGCPNATGGDRPPIHDLQAPLITDPLGEPHASAVRHDAPPATTCRWAGRARPRCSRSVLPGEKVRNSPRCWSSTTVPLTSRSRSRRGSTGTRWNPSVAPARCPVGDELGEGDGAAPVQADRPWSGAALPRRGPARPRAPRHRDPRADSPAPAARRGPARPRPPRPAAPSVRRGRGPGRRAAEVPRPRSGRRPHDSPPRSRRRSRTGCPCGGAPHVEARCAGTPGPSASAASAAPPEPT